jgi:3-phenylpropionate/trans-cinnamate dioxygenase ferredoxin component
MVRCTPRMISKNENWVAVCPATSLTAQAFVCARVGTVDLLLMRDGDKIFACERFCPHEQADLSQGRISDGRLFCPRHFASFDLLDGNMSAGWPSRDLRVYPARIEDDTVWVDAGAMGLTE